jgi:hypothetical protein
MAVFMYAVPTRVRLSALAVAGALLVAAPVQAGQPGLDPDKAEELRAAARTKAGESGSAAEEADVLFRSGQELGDPVLMLDGADRLRTQADTERSKEIARTALGLVAIALDVTAYMASEHYSRTRWRPVAPEVVSSVQTRAETLQSDLEGLIEEIEEEERAAAAAAAAAAAEGDDERKRGPAKPGTGLVAGGAGMMVLGAGGLGLMTAGLMIGGDVQNQVEALDLSLPGARDEYDQLDAKGKRANVFAIAGGVVGAVGLGVGLGLIIAGVKKRRGAEPEEGAETASIMLVPRLTGATLVGRF